MKISKKTLVKEAKEAGVKPELYINWIRYNNFIFERNNEDKSIQYKWDGSTHFIRGLKLQIHFMNNSYLELKIIAGKDNEIMTLLLFSFSENNASLLYVVMVAVIENFLNNNK